MSLSLLHKQGVKLDSECLLLASQSCPHIGLHLTRGGFLEQPCQQGIAGRPCQPLALLLEQHCQIIVDAHHMLLTGGRLSERGHYDDPQEPADRLNVVDSFR